jgi:bacterial regulatory protein, Crp family
VETFELLRLVPALADAIPPNVALALAKASIPVELGPQEQLLQAQVGERTVVYLAAGFACGWGPSQAAFSPRLYRPNSWLLPHYALDLASGPPSIKSLTHAIFILMPQQGLLEALVRNPVLALSINQKLILQLQLDDWFLCALRTKSAEGRCAAVFYHLAHDIFRQPAFECPLSQTDLADLAGLRRETFNRALRKLQAKGLVKMKNSYVRIPNPESLNQVN